MEESTYYILQKKKKMQEFDFKNTAMYQWVGLVSEWPFLVIHLLPKMWAISRLGW